jgi:hypothetical protein
LARSPTGKYNLRFGPAHALLLGEGAKNMLWTICIVLLVLWALGMATAYTAGGLIHILLVLALVIMVIRLISGRRILG